MGTPKPAQPKLSKPKSCKPKPTEEERQRAQMAAEKKAREAQEKKEKEKREKEEAKRKELEKDQEWLDKNTKNMSAAEKRELFRILSRDCKAATMVNGRIVLGCSLPKGFHYCEPEDKKSALEGEEQKNHLKNVSTALNENSTCIDVPFVKELEGGTHVAPYVPWGPYAGKKKNGPQLTTNNRSGVTVGSGVDLGCHNTDEKKKKYLKQLEDAGVTQETRDRITPLLGKRKDQACKALNEAKAQNSDSFQLPREDVERMDREAMQSRKDGLEEKYQKKWKKKVQPQIDNILNELKNPVPDQAKIDAWQAEIDATPKFHQLPCHEQTVLFSTLYQEGNLDGEHSKAMLDGMLNRKPAEVRAGLAMKTTSGSQVVKERGQKELEYYDRECAKLKPKP